MGVVGVLMAVMGSSAAINAKGCTPLDAWTFDKVINFIVFFVNACTENSQTCVDYSILSGRSSGIVCLK